MAGVDARARLARVQSARIHSSASRAALATTANCDQTMTATARPQPNSKTLQMAVTAWTRNAAAADDSLAEWASGAAARPRAWASARAPHGVARQTELKQSTRSPAKGGRQRPHQCGPPKRRARSDSDSCAAAASWRSMPIRALPPGAGAAGAGTAASARQTGGPVAPAAAALQRPRPRRSPVARRSHAAPRAPRARTRRRWRTPTRTRRERRARPRPCWGRCQTV